MLPGSGIVNMAGGPPPESSRVSLEIRREAIGEPGERPPVKKSPQLSLGNRLLEDGPH